MTLWVLIGCGVNNMQIPALVWTDKDKALAECRSILGDDFKTKPKDDTYDETYHWQTKRSFPEDAMEKIWTSYYGGCGDCYRMSLVPIEEGQPFVHWDLD